MKLTIELTKEQHQALKTHAEAKHRTPEVDLVAVWWGRTQALLSYAAKVAKGVPMTPHVPRELPEAERERLKKLLGHRGKKAKATSNVVSIKSARKKTDHDRAPAPASLTLGGITILKTDSYVSALNKAEKIALGTKRRVLDVLSAAGRDANGMLL